MSKNLKDDWSAYYDNEESKTDAEWRNDVANTINNIVSGSPYISVTHGHNYVSIGFNGKLEQQTAILPDFPFKVSIGTGVIGGSFEGVQCIQVQAGDAYILNQGIGLSYTELAIPASPIEHVTVFLRITVDGDWNTHLDTIVAEVVETGSFPSALDTEYLYRVANISNLQSTKNINQRIWGDLFDMNTPRKDALYDVLQTVGDAEGSQIGWDCLKAK